ncbi:hypothetical protein JCM11491_001188 [Sporobolomyces phaffii]
MPSDYTPLDHPAPPKSSRTRTVSLAVAAFLATFLVLSLSAHRNAPSSPSAERAAHYLPSLSLSRDPDSNRDGSLEYRQQLELATSPAQFLTHSPTLAFSHIYVLSLPSRQDRRDQMTQLARALGITIEFVDAMDKQSPVFGWIADRVQETRKLRKKIISKARKVAQSSVGGISIAGDWLTPYPDHQHAPSTVFPTYPLPPSTSPLRKQLAATDSRDWVEHLEKLDSLGRLAELEPAKRGVDVTKQLWDPLERVKVRQLSRGVMSTWFGQTRVMKRIVERGDESALVLEDDVDFEWDLERLWNTVQRKLPNEWDITYLGHCWGGENQKPQYLHPLLHHSTGPMCLHAYALTRSGARRILSHLSSPWIAYQSAVDLALPTLLHYDLVTSFSVVPPLVIQRKDGPSDLQKGTGSKWRGVLRDSTWERVLRDKGEWHSGWEDEWDEKNVDPATELRCGPVT